MTREGAVILGLVLGVVVARAAVQPPLQTGARFDWDGLADELGVPKHLRNLAHDLELDTVVDLNDMTNEEAELHWRTRSNPKLRNTRRRHEDIHGGKEEDPSEEEGGELDALTERLVKRFGKGLRSTIRSTDLGEHRERNFAPGSMEFLELEEHEMLGNIVDTDPRPKCAKYRGDDTCDNPNVRNQYLPSGAWYKYYVRLHVVKAKDQTSFLGALKQEVTKEVHQKDIQMMITNANKILAKGHIKVSAQLYYWTSDNFSRYSIGSENDGGTCINFRSYTHNLKKFGSSHFGDTHTHVIIAGTCGGKSSTAGFAYYPFYARTHSGWVVLRSDQLGIDTTFVHELGHSLALAHTFVGVQGGSSGDSTLQVCSLCYESVASDYRGDFISDTQPHMKGGVAESGGTLPGGADYLRECGVPGEAHCVACSGKDQCQTMGKFPDNANGRNIMSYNNDKCRTDFTDKQLRRMRCWGTTGTVAPAFRKQCTSQTRMAYRCCKKKVMWFCQQWGTCYKNAVGEVDC